jgi:G3E family GTPase
MQPFTGYLNRTELAFSEQLLANKTGLISEKHFQAMKDMLKKGVPQMEMTWVSL